MAALKFVQKEIELRQNLAGANFTTPPGSGGAKVTIMGELVSAQNFEDDDVYIFMEVKLPEGWSFNTEDYLDPRATETDTPDLVNRGRTVTQISRQVTDWDMTKSFHHFCFPVLWCFEVSQEGLAKQWPEVLVQVNSCDTWNRHRIQGYGFLKIPNTSGFKKIKVRTWRPMESNYNETHSFFLGGSTRIENPWELSDTYVISEEGEKAPVNRFGLLTRGSGSVNFQFSTVIQSEIAQYNARRTINAMNFKQKSELAWKQRDKKETSIISSVLANLELTKNSYRPDSTYDRSFPNPVSP